MLCKIQAKLIFGLFIGSATEKYVFRNMSHVFHIFYANKYCL